MNSKKKGATLEKYSGRQSRVAAVYARRIVEHEWFSRRFEGVARRPMTRLLLALYVRRTNEELPGRKEAGTMMGVEHNITTHRYLELGNKLGLLKTVRSKIDRRKHLIYLTAHGVEVVEGELARIADDVILAAAALVEETIPPGRGLPVLSTPEGDEAANWVVDELFGGYASFVSRPPLDAGDKDYQRAIRRLTETIRIQPNNAVAYIRRGYQFFLMGHYDSAIADYTNAVTLEPRHMKAVGLRGMARFVKGDYAGAVKDYDIVIRNDPASSLAYFQRGEAKALQRKRRAAIADFRKAMSLDPAWEDPREALFDMGVRIGLGRSQSVMRGHSRKSG